MSRERYPSDLSDAQWEQIEPYVPKPKLGGRPASVSRREIVNAILYLVREGITWRAMPHDLPDYRTVYHYFARWRDDGTWQAIHDALRDEVRTAAAARSVPQRRFWTPRASRRSNSQPPVGALTAGRRSKGASGIWPSTCSVCCW